MTVAELIERLKEMPQDARVMHEVFIPSYEETALYDVTDIFYDEIGKGTDRDYKPVGPHVLIY